MDKIRVYFNLFISQLIYTVYLHKKNLYIINNITMIESDPPIFLKRTSSARRQIFLTSASGVYHPAN